MRKLLEFSPLVEMLKNNKKANKAHMIVISPNEIKTHYIVIRGDK